MYLAILCALFGMVKWPFQRLSDLQLGDQKVPSWITWYKICMLYTHVYIPIPCCVSNTLTKSYLTCSLRWLNWEFSYRIPLSALQGIALSMNFRNPWHGKIMFKKHPEISRCFSLMLTAPSLLQVVVFGYLNTKPKTVYLEHDVGLSSDNVMQQNHDTPEVSGGRPEKLPGRICSTYIITYPPRK